MLGYALAAVALAPVLGFAVWAAVVYNRLVILSKKRGEAWNCVLVRLMRRHDLVPNLVTVFGAYAARESDVLDEVNGLRAFGYSTRVREVGEAERKLSRSLTRLLAVAENYPGLKSDRSFRELQNTLVRVEDEIQMARSYYNTVVRDLNILATTFPGRLLAKRFAFQPSPLFELESPAEADMPTVSFDV